jgi:hypothetical protein
MADKRIIELDTKEAIAVDDYVPVDGETGGTKKFLASQLGGKAEVMTEAEWEDLPDDKYTDNKVYVLTDAEPPESQLFAKVGSASLDTSADNLSDAINEHESDISTLNSNLTDLIKFKNYSCIYSVTANGNADITANDLSVSTPSGYTPIGFCLIATGDASVITRNIYLRATGSSTMVKVRNISTFTLSNILFEISIAYIKSSFVGS